MFVMMTMAVTMLVAVMMLAHDMLLSKPMNGSLFLSAEYNLKNPMQMRTEMNDNELTLDLSITVPLRITDFDRYGRLKPSAILCLFQEAATRQAELMGIGRKDMLEHGVFWVVVRTAFDVIEYPEAYDEVVVRTWPHTPSRFSFLRDYTVSLPGGDVIIKGTAEWVLMSVDDRSFVPLSSVYEPTGNYVEERIYEKKPRKLHDFDADEDPYVVVPPYMSVDLNGHVNNAVYADYPFDAIDPDGSYALESFQIDYRHEVKEGQPLSIYTKSLDGVLMAKGVSQDGELAFMSSTGFSA